MCQRHAEHHHHVPAGVGAHPDLQSMDVGLAQPAVLGQFIAGLTGLEPEALESFCELQRVIFLSWETDTGWSNPASTGVDPLYRGEEPVWSGITLYPY